MLAALLRRRVVAAAYRGGPAGAPWSSLASSGPEETVVIAMGGNVVSEGEEGRGLKLAPASGGRPRLSLTSLRFFFFSIIHHSFA